MIVPIVLVHSHTTLTIEAIQTYPKIHRLFQDSMLFLQYPVPKWHSKHERVETKLLHQYMVQFPYKPILHYPYSLLKENNSAINRLPLGLYALFYRTPAKIMWPPQAQTVQYRFFRRSRRLYGNQKSPLSCQSSRSLRNIFEMIRAIGTMGRSCGNQALE